MDDGILEMWTYLGLHIVRAFILEMPSSQHHTILLKHKKKSSIVIGRHVTKWIFSCAKCDEFWKVECLLWQAFHFSIFFGWYLMDTFKNKIKIMILSKYMLEIIGRKRKKIKLFWFFMLVNNFGLACSPNKCLFTSKCTYFENAQLGGWYPTHNPG